MKRGDMRWYKFMAPDKKHPVLILTRNSIIEYLGEITIAPLTSTIRDIPSEVFISKEENGLMRDCAINCDHLQTVSKAKIGTLITTLGADKMHQVRNSIQFALDL